MLFIGGGAMDKEYIFFLSYIKKTITYRSIQIKTKHKKTYDLEKFILNQRNDNAEEKINLIEDTRNIEENLDFVIDYNDFNEIFNDKKISDSFNSLTEKQKQVLYELFVNNKSEREVAKKLDSSFQNINKIKKAALKKINKKLEENKYVYKN